MASFQRPQMASFRAVDLLCCPAGTVPSQHATSHLDTVDAVAPDAVASIYFAQWAARETVADSRGWRAVPGDGVACNQKRSNRRNAHATKNVVTDATCMQPNIHE